jgi:dihydrofolate synthase/folylpolyglutamate synthase
LGVVNDKDLDQILPLFPKMPFIIFQSQNNHALDAILADKANQHGLTGTVFNSITTAYQTHWLAEDTDLIYIGGSTLWLQKFYKFFLLRFVYSKQPYICTHQ